MISPRETKHSAKLLLSLLVLALISFSMCGSSSTRINIRLTNATPFMDAVTVSWKVDDWKDPRSPYKFDKNTTYFGFDIPEPYRHGQLAVSIEVFDTQCTVATGQVQAILNAEDVVELTVPLIQQAKTCPILVQTTGAGRVTSNPQGIDCGDKCQMTALANTQLTLTATPDIPGTPYNWSGKCYGSKQCQINIDGPITVGIDFTPRVCSSDGWCWDNPYPQGNPLNGVWVAPDKTVIAVGGHGTVLRSNGAGWSSIQSNTTEDLYAIWGTSLQDLWAVGSNGKIIHWNGMGWFSSPSNTSNFLYAVWGSGPSDIWAIGDAGTILHSDGSTWSPQTTGITGTSVRFRSIWGTSANSVYVSDRFGGIYNWNGTKWMLVDSGAFSGEGLWGSGTGDIWLVGSMTTRHWNGSAWNSVPAPTNDLTSIWGTGPNTIWTAGNNYIGKWDGSAWSSVSSITASWASLNGSSANDVWAVGTPGAIAHWDGTTWNSLYQTVSAGIRWNAGLSTSSTDAWVVGSGGAIARWDGIAQQWKPYQQPSTYSFADIWGTHTDDLWAVGTNVVRWNGTAWNVVDTGIVGYIAAVAGNDTNDVWLMTDAGKIYHWTGPGTSWVRANTAPLAPSSNARDLLVIGTHMWVVADGSLHYWDGANWTSVATAATNYNISGSTETAIYLTSSTGISHWNGRSWVAESAPTGISYYGVNAITGSNIWATGNRGEIVHSDGTTWTTLNSGTSVQLNSIFVTTPRDVFAIGESDVILHYRAGYP